MKEFEKYIQKQQFALLEYSKASREGIIKMQKIGWRAALEWVNKECAILDENCCLDCRCFSMVQNKIEEELDED